MVVFTMVPGEGSLFTLERTFTSLRMRTTPAIRETTPAAAATSTEIKPPGMSAQSGIRNQLTMATMKIVMPMPINVNVIKRRMGAPGEVVQIRVWILYIF